MIDRARITVKAGNGGNGSLSFRHEKYVPLGGPDGGDGGRGGNIILVVNESMRTLADFRHKRIYRAKPGGYGEGGKRHGANGPDLLINVPPGTIVREFRDSDDDSEGDLLGDLMEPGQRLIVAHGGRGGHGNVHFANSTNRAPHIAENGDMGEERELVLDLKLIADVGIAGLPNAGKSTLLRAVSMARPKVADYPFTTLEPALGVVDVGYQSMVLADIPGLIEGAHEGTGLGHDFLRHIERTRVLVHLVDGSRPDPLADIETINAELAAYSPALAQKRQAVVVNKLDLPEVRDNRDRIAATLQAKGFDPTFISAAGGEGIPEFIERLMALVTEVEETKVEEASTATPILRPEPRRPRFEIKRLDNGFEIEGPLVRRWVDRIGGDSDEAKAEIMRRLLRMGVGGPLRRAGARPGDRLLVAGKAMEWQG